MQKIIRSHDHLLNLQKIITFQFSIPISQVLGESKIESMIIFTFLILTSCLDEHTTQDWMKVSKKKGKN